MAQSIYYQLNELVKSKQNSGDNVVNDSYVDFCLKFISKISVNSTEEAFAYFAAVNYLNFATKIKHQIGYGFKNKLQYIIAECIDKHIPGVRFYLTKDKSMDVLYCLFDEVFLFSFHSPTFQSESLKNWLRGCSYIAFDGIRKQNCPTIILNAAIKMLKGKKSYNTFPSENYGATYNSSNSSGAGNNKNFHHINCSIDVYPISDIIKHYHLDKLVNDKVGRDNIAIVISTLFFYQDLINNNPSSVPVHIKKAMFRETVTQTFSVLEAVEVYVGKRIAIANHLEHGNNNETDKKLQEHYIKLCQKKFPLDKDAEKLYKEYKDLRHNVHLCKAQQIMNDSYYNEDNVEKWFSFMDQYLLFIAESL